MKPYIGITTYNRKELVERTIGTLMAVDNINNCEIVFFDDCSTEYGADFLKNLIPNSEVYRNEKNLGADHNTFVMFEKFLESDCDVLIVADSDLIYRKDAIVFVLEHIKEHPFFTLFNTDYHKAIGNYDDYFIEKESVGAAACCIERSMVKIIMDYMQGCGEYNYFDWRFCEILREHGVNILSVKNSFVQHVGMVGFNTCARRFDYGKGFVIDSLECAQIIEDLVEKYESDVFHMNDVLSKSFLWKILLWFKRLIRKN